MTLYGKNCSRNFASLLDPPLKSFQWHLPVNDHDQSIVRYCFPVVSRYSFQITVASLYDGDWRTTTTGDCCRCIFGRGLCCLLSMLDVLTFSVVVLSALFPRIISYSLYVSIASLCSVSLSTVLLVWYRFSVVYFLVSLCRDRVSRRWILLCINRAI